jgi:hypothetical protein
MYSAIRWLWTGDPPGELIFKQMASRLGWLKAESICFLAFLKLTPVSLEMLPERVMRDTQGVEPLQQEWKMFIFCSAGL